MKAKMFTVRVTNLDLGIVSSERFVAGYSRSDAEQRALAALGAGWTIATSYAMRAVN